MSYHPDARNLINNWRATLGGVPDKFPSSAVPLIEHWSGRSPFRENHRSVGALDYLSRRAQGGIVLRGWAFDLSGVIESLDLMIGDDYFPVLCYGLYRSDVGNTFPFIPQAATSGFVIYCDYQCTEEESSKLPISFVARVGLDNVSGIFDATTRVVHEIRGDAQREPAACS